MIAREAILAFDLMKPNNYTVQDKLKWIAKLEQTIYEEIMVRREGCDREKPDMITEDWELFASPPYELVYQHWMGTQVDYNNGEIDKYNNSNQMFEAVYGKFRNWYNREHMPIPVRNIY